MLRRVLSAAVRSVSAEPTFWLTLAEDLAAIDPSAGAEQLAKALTSRDHNTRELAEKHLIELAARSPAVVMKAAGDAFLHPSDGVWLQLGDVSALLQAIPDGVVREWVDRNGLPAARAIARHLIPPHLHEGEPVVPPLTAYVLGTFEEDERVFREFVAGAHSWQVYADDISAQYLEEAQTAQRFTGHPLRRIREWAMAETEAARRHADYWRQRAEEDETR